jgi:hypothetical protein
MMVTNKFITSIYRNQLILNYEHFSWHSSLFWKKGLYRRKYTGEIQNSLFVRFCLSQSKTSFSILRFFEVLIELYYGLSGVRSVNLRSDFAPPPPKSNKSKTSFSILSLFEVLIGLYSRLSSATSSNLMWL